MLKGVKETNYKSYIGLTKKINDMKKSLLSILAIAPIGLFAQTTILSDNFDSYTVPTTVVAASGGLWDTWSGGAGTAEDAAVSDSISSSTSNSMHVTNGGAGVYTNDMILAFPSTYTTGKYEFKMKIFVPQGFGGYFNLGGNWVSGGAGFQYGGDFFFNSDGSGTVDGPSTLLFSHNVNAWNTVSVMVDLGAATKTLTVNGVLVGTNAWGAAAGFGVSDVFGVGYSDPTLATEVASSFYVDDVELLDWTFVGLEEANLDAQVVVYPSPNDGQFKIEFKEALSPNYLVTITDLSGKVIESSNVAVNTATSAEFNLNVAKGFYLVNVTNGTNTYTQKIAIK